MLISDEILLTANSKATPTKRPPPISPRLTTVIEFKKIHLTAKLGSASGLIQFWQSLESFHPNISKLDSM